MSSTETDAPFPAPINIPSNGRTGVRTGGAAQRHREPIGTGERTNTCCVRSLPMIKKTSDSRTPGGEGPGGKSPFSRAGGPGGKRGAPRARVADELKWRQRNRPASQGPGGCTYRSDARREGATVLARLSSAAPSGLSTSVRQLEDASRARTPSKLRSRSKMAGN